MTPNAVEVHSTFRSYVAPTMQAPGQPYMISKLGCAVELRPHLYLTASHVIKMAGGKLASLRVGPSPAMVWRANPDLALLLTGDDPPERVDALLSDVEDMDADLTLVPLHHRHYDHEKKEGASRIATWTNTQHIREFNVPGMSGSGIWNGGKLAGIVEWTNGYCFGPLDLRTFLEGAK